MNDIFTKFDDECEDRYKADIDEKESVIQCFLGTCEMYTIRIVRAKHTSVQMVYPIDR